MSLACWGLSGLICEVKLSQQTSTEVSFALCLEASMVGAWGGEEGASPRGRSVLRADSTDYATISSAANCLCLRPSLRNSRSLPCFVWWVGGLNLNKNTCAEVDPAIALALLPGWQGGAQASLEAR